MPGRGEEAAKPDAKKIYERWAIEALCRDSVSTVLQEGREGPWRRVSTVLENALPATMESLLIIYCARHSPVCPGSSRKDGGGDVSPPQAENHG